MGLDSLSKFHIHLLQALVSLLLLVLTMTTGWTMLEMYKLKCDLPKDYVMLERYTRDQATIDAKVDNLSYRTQTGIDRLDSKLDKLLTRDK